LLDKRHRAYLGLGSNLGSRLDNLRAGLRRLGPVVQVTAISALYETAPIGVTEQPSFLNAVCSVTTTLAPHPLLDRLKEIERELGRTEGRRWGPRPLDLDILLYDEDRIELRDLEIPHPRLRERAFVLRPLSELDPDLVIPGDGRTVRALLEAVAAQEVRLVAGPGWEHEESSL
jgi:2-amino-4-hydroxy-6-hydroxymethyldihydropteridine diphosphokinase